MSIARGILKGFLKQGLESKAKSDDLYADMVRETGIEFKKTSQLFRQEEKDAKQRFKSIEAAHGLPSALYASYHGFTTSNFSANSVIKQLNENPEFKEQLKDFDFQGYGYSTAKSSRLTNFKTQNKNAIDILSKHQVGPNVGEMYLKPIKPKEEVVRPEGEIVRPELDLPKLSEFKVGTSIRDYSAKTDLQLLRILTSNFKDNIRDPDLGGFENITKNNPYLLEGYQDAKDLGYAGSDIDYAREKYIKTNMAKPSININYTADYEVFIQKAKERDLLTGKISEEIDLPKQIPVSGKEKTEAFVFGDYGKYKNILHTEKINEINISLSNGISKILADTSLNEDQKNAAIQTLKIAAADAKKKLGPVPEKSKKSSGASILFLK